MALRRFLLVTALFLFALAFVSALTASPPEDRAEKPAFTRPSSPPPTTKGVIGRRDGPARVQARVGDIVELTVRSEQRADVVEVGDLGLDAPVEPGIPAEFEFLADRAGRFPVRSTLDGRQLGVLLVTSSGPARRAPE